MKPIGTDEEEQGDQNAESASTKLDGALDHSILEDDSNDSSLKLRTSNQNFSDPNLSNPKRSRSGLNPNKDLINNASDDHSSSSSSSSSANEDSTSGGTSSNSDSDLDPDVQFQQSLQKSSKKAELLQRISQSVHQTSIYTNPSDIRQHITCTTSATATSATTTTIITTTSSLSPASFSTSGTNLKRNLPDSSEDSSTMELGMKRSRPMTPPIPAGIDMELFNTVKKYLIRKPITAKELLKKIRLRKLVGKNDDAQILLANVLRQLRPIKQTINGQHVLSLKK